MWKSSPSVNLLGVMACVAAGFFLVLKVGFLLHHDPIPAPFESTGLTAVSVLVLLGGFAALTRAMARAVAQAGVRAKAQREAKVAQEQYAEERRRRVAELAADPARAKYAPLVERGENWSDEEIAYVENPEATATCIHLQPIERAIRAAGIPVRRYTKAYLNANCCIDFDALQREFPTDAPVRYAEFYDTDRGNDYYPVAFLTCDEHKSLVYTVHPDERESKNAPWFPAP